MSLMLWKDNGWVRSHTTGKEEVNNLLMIVDRDLEDFSKGYFC